jgi:hypothetical protein
MKTNSAVTKAVESAKGIQGNALGEKEKNKLQFGSSLSPERTMAGASTITPLLSQILEQSRQPHQLRSWGINE